MTKRSETTYRALVDTSHRDNPRLITRAGEMIDVSHLEPDEIQLLVDRGALEEVEPRQPVSGKDD